MTVDRVTIRTTEDRTLSRTYSRAHDTRGPDVTTTKPKPLTREQETRLRVENALALREAEAKGLHRPAGETLGARYVASETYTRARDLPFLSAEATGLTLETPDEFRARALVTFEQSVGPAHVSYEAGPGGVVAARLEIVPADGQYVGVARETARTEAAAPTPFGTALPEADWTFDAETFEGKRIGLFAEITRDAWSDAGTVARVVDELAYQDVNRAIDAQVLSGDGTGENLLGVLDAGAAVPTQSVTGTRWDSLLRAITTVRGAGHRGLVSVVLNPVSALAILTERDGDVGLFRREVLELLDAELVLSSVAPSGTAVVADLFRLGSLHVREGVAVRASTSHADNLRKGLVAVIAEARVDLSVSRPSAGVILTGV